MERQLLDATLWQAIRLEVISAVLRKIIQENNGWLEVTPLKRGCILFQDGDSRRYDE